MKPKFPPEVSLVRCPDYHPDHVLAAVHRAVDLVGGMGSVVSPGDRVLIKPNLLKAAPAGDAVVTHPEIVRAVIRLVHDAGGRAAVGDSPGFGDLKRVSEKTGLLDVINREGASLAEMTEAVPIRNQGQFQHFEIARAVHEADVVINLPKFKTHGMMTLTGAVKNLFGCIPGRRKVQWHFKTGVNRQAFARMLVELSVLVKPELTIMDAVVGMEGNGPGSGNAREMGLVLAGRDAVAIDAVCGKLVGLDPAVLPVVRAASEAAIGETRLERIALRGEELASVSIGNFRLPVQEHLEWRLPEWARRVLKDALTTRPVIDQNACIRCGVCRGHCPQGAITDAGARFEISYRECIRCFCCQEFCPQGAVTVGRGWGLRLFR